MDAAEDAPLDLNDYRRPASESVVVVAGQALDGTEKATVVVKRIVANDAGLELDVPPWWEQPPHSSHLRRWFGAAGWLVWTAALLAMPFGNARPPKVAVSAVVVAFFAVMMGAIAAPFRQRAIPRAIPWRRVRRVRIDHVLGRARIDAVKRAGGAELPPITISASREALADLARVAAHHVPVESFAGETPPEVRYVSFVARKPEMLAVDLHVDEVHANAKAIDLTLRRTVRKAVAMTMRGPTGLWLIPPLVSAQIQASRSGALGEFHIVLFTGLLGMTVFEVLSAARGGRVSFAWYEIDRLQIDRALGLARIDFRGGIDADRTSTVFAAPVADLDALAALAAAHTRVEVASIESTAATAARLA